MYLAMFGRGDRIIINKRDHLRMLQKNKNGDVVTDGGSYIAITNNSKYLSILRQQAGFFFSLCMSLYTRHQWGSVPRCSHMWRAPRLMRLHHHITYIYPNGQNLS